MRLGAVKMVLTVAFLYTFAEVESTFEHRLHKRYMADLTLPSVIASLSRRNVCDSVDCQYFELMKFGRRKRDLSLLKYELCCKD
ncbi:uncharacterized protein LOC144624888 isoform X2 [Crassostrea virginica]